LTSALNLGSRERFVTASANLFPRVVLDERVSPDEFHGHGGPTPRGLRLVVLRTPRGDPLLLVEACYGPSASIEDLAEFMVHMHDDRDRLAYGDEPLGRWLARRVAATAELRIGYAHQMVVVGEPLAQQILAERRESRITTIEMILQHPDLNLRGAAGIRIPATLELPGRAVVANSRHASLVAGWDRDIQDSLVLVALNVIGAFAVLRQARVLAFRALENDLNFVMTTIVEARERHARLAADLGEIQLDLSFGVETYLDSVLVPDSRMDSFRTAYHEAVDMEAARANTARIIERLRAVVQSRSSVLAEASREREERRDRVLSAMLAVGSLIAIPLTILLGFFGIQTRDLDPSRSMFDVAHYWPVYLLAWLPFTLLVLVGIALRRRVSRARPRIYGLGSTPTPTVDNWTLDRAPESRQPSPATAESV